MKPWFFETYRPLRAPDDGAGAAAGADGAAGTGGQQAGQADAGAAGAAAAGQEGSNPAAAAAGQPYRPEGLPDTMFGKDDRETMDKMHAALKGYRERDATRVVPETPDAYREFKIDEAPEALRPHLQVLLKDPLFDTVSKVALEEKIPVATMQKLTTALYAQALEAGVLEPAVDPEVERAQLLPESARNLPKAQQDAAIDARMQANEDFIKLLSKPGADGKPVLDPKVGEHALLMLMDTAAGNQFLETIRNQLTGGDRANPLAGGAGAGSGDQRAALRAKMSAPEMNPQHPKFDRAAYDALDAEYKRMFAG